MPEWDMLIENIMSLAKEYEQPINTPDIHDLAEMSAALGLSIEALVLTQTTDLGVIGNLTAAYVRMAYGLGRNRGRAEERNKDA